MSVESSSQLEELSDFVEPVVKSSTKAAQSSIVTAETIMDKLSAAKWTVFPNIRDSTDWYFVMNATNPPLTPQELIILKNELFKPTPAAAAGTVLSVEYFNAKLEAKLAALEISMRYVSSEVANRWGGKHFDGISSFKQYCMVLGPSQTHCRFLCANLRSKHNAGRVLMDIMGFTKADISNNRNFLRLHASIEKAFDCKRLTFVPVDNFDPTNNEQALELKVVVLDPALLKETFSSCQVTKHFSEIDNLTLHYKFANDKLPLLRLLTLHAYGAYEKAMKNGWISFNDCESGRQRCRDLASKSLEIC